MSSRKNIPPAYEGNTVPAPGLIRRGIPPGHPPMEPLRPDALEDRLAVQAMDIEQLVEDNRRLLATRVALRQDVVTAQQEVQRLTEHIRSMQAESDIQIRVLLDKIAKMEVDIRAGVSVRKELQQALSQARSLALARKESTNQIQRASQELEKTRADMKKLPEMRTELDSLKKEHERLRMTFEYEKGKNMEKVEKMRIMEKDLVGMAGEVERLRAEVFRAEQRAHAPPNPYAGPYSHPNALYPPSVYGSGVYVDNYGRPLQMGGGAMPQGVTPYGGPVPANAPVGAATGAVTGAGGNTSWGGTYDVSHAPS